MSRQIQIRRGTSAEHNNFTGAIGEITMDTTNNTLRVHDGVTPGGNETMSLNKYNSNITNCITEIPQDIKLELNNGTLTLKAGSKCYLKTDTTSPSISVATDLTTTQTTDGTYFAIYNGSALTTVSKSTYDYSSLPNTYSLPLGIVNVSNGAIASLDDIFNGFGYIGSTVFALPGVKGLIPNGRNSDGSSNNTEYTLTSLATLDMSVIISDYRTIILKSDGTLERANKISLTHDNYLLRDGSPRQAFSVINCVTNSSGKIDVFYKYNVFCVSNINNKDFFAHQSMPSKVNVDLTLGSSGTTYTSPADGYFYISKLTNGTNQYLQLINQSAGNMQYFAWGPTNGAQIRLVIPAGKGDSIQIAYTAGGNTQAFKFIYANGAI